MKQHTKNLDRSNIQTINSDYNPYLQGEFGNIRVPALISMQITEYMPQAKLMVS